MVKKSSTSEGDRSESVRPGEYRFVNITLTESEKKSGDQWCSTVDLDAVLQEVLLSASGYKVSVTHNEKGDVFIATMSAKAGDNLGLLMTARAKSPYQAIARVLFIHAVLFDSGGWVEREVDDNVW